jgi:hypothetical protein
MGRTLFDFRTKRSSREKRETKLTRQVVLLNMLRKRDRDRLRVAYAGEAVGEKSQRYVEG